MWLADQFNTKHKGTQCGDNDLLRGEPAAMLPAVLLGQKEKGSPEHVLFKLQRHNTEKIVVPRHATLQTLHPFTIRLRQPSEMPFETAGTPYQLTQRSRSAWPST